MANRGATRSASSFDDKLNVLKTKLEDLEKELSKKTKDRDALKADFAALEKIVNEITQTVSGYQEAPLTEDRNAAQQYYDTKSRMVEAAIKDIKDKVEAEITKVDRAIADKDKNVNTKEEAAKTASDELEAAKKSLEDKQRAYDQLKNYQKDVSSSLQKLKELRKKIEERDDQNDSTGMYVYLREFRRLLDETVISKKDEYQQSLSTAWAELNEAKNDLRREQSEWDDARNSLAQAQAELKTLKDNRVGTILEKTKNITPDSNASTDQPSSPSATSTTVDGMS